MRNCVFGGIDYHQEKLAVKDLLSAHHFEPLCNELFLLHGCFEPPSVGCGKMHEGYLWV
jgi:hypothetical protein